MKFQCPECGATPHKHGRRKCLGAGEQCDGFICECDDDDAEADKPGHGTSLNNSCHNSFCTHCRWRGTMPKTPMGLQAWEKKALGAGWTMPTARKKELGL